MNKGGKRFEIACYRNKVVDWRAGLELDLSEVLQTDRVFTNVSKGEFAKSKDLQKVFGSKDEEVISKLILEKGQLQVSDKERNQQLEKTTAQIAEWISKNCVHPTSQRPYTISQIKHCMQQANFSVHPTKPLKRQYLDCVKLLQTVIPIQRAKMELLVVVPQSYKSQVESLMEEHKIVFQKHQEQRQSSQDTTSLLRYPILVDPSLYRILNDGLESMAVSGERRNDSNSNPSSSSSTATAATPTPTSTMTARIEIINQVVTKQGDANLEESMVVSAATEVSDASADANTSDTAGVDGKDIAISSPTKSNSETKDDEDDDDDDVADLLQGLALGRKDEDEEDDSGDVGGQVGKSDDDSEDEEEQEDIQLMDRRKAQKSAKKKNKKTQRRTTTSTSSTNADEDKANHTERKNKTSENHSDDTKSTKTIDTLPVTGPLTSNGSGSGDGRKSCNTCGGSFSTAAEYRSHFKSDWHRFNQKLKLNGSPPISEQEFLLCDADSLFRVDTGGL